MTYKQAVTWAEDIKDYSGNRKMPPWKPTGGALAFHNDRRMAEADIKTLAEWVDGGVPEGDPKDAPKPIAYPDGWMLGKPDLVLIRREDFHLAQPARTRSAATCCRPICPKTNTSSASK